MNESYYWYQLNLIDLFRDCNEFFRGDGPLTAQMTEVIVMGELMGESW